jgi:hypothetical protein
MRFQHAIYISILGLGLVACTGPTTVDDSQYYPSKYPGAKEVGEYRIVSFEEPWRGELGIKILDRNDEPVRLESSRVKAEITYEDGSSRETWLAGDGYIRPMENLQEYEGIPGTAVYRKRVDSEAQPHPASMTVHVPLPDGKIHKLSFSFD